MMLVIHRKIIPSYCQRYARVLVISSTLVLRCFVSTSLIETALSSNLIFYCYSKIGDEVAIKCPIDPPYPEGWYSGVVIEVIRHDLDSFKPSGKKSAASKSKQKDFTIHVEWDGGGVEKLRNPEWRMKGDEPDKQGRISHRDARVRFHFLISKYSLALHLLHQHSFTVHLFIFSSSAPTVF